MFRTEIVGAEPGETVLGGYSLVRAPDLPAAVAMAKGCPGLDAGLSIEVGEVKNLDESFDAFLAEHPIA